MFFQVFHLVTIGWFIFLGRFSNGLQVRERRSTLTHLPSYVRELTGNELVEENVENGRDFHGNGDNDVTSTGGIDFSKCEDDPETGLCCLEREGEVETLEKDPVLVCKHRTVEQCHYTYVTRFVSAKQTVCQQNFEKKCSITFEELARNETVQKCFGQVEKVCNGEGEEQCKTAYESSCTTRYIQKHTGQFVGDTTCKKLPVLLCGKGCVYQEGPLECHDDVVASVVQVPEELCDINPRKICKVVSRLVPKLQAVPECVSIPRETCSVSFGTPQRLKKPFRSRYCIDSSEDIQDTGAKQSTFSTETEDKKPPASHRNDRKGNHQTSLDLDLTPPPLLTGYVAPSSIFGVPLTNQDPPGHGSPSNLPFVPRSSHGFRPPATEAFVPNVYGRPPQRTGRTLFQPAILPKAILG